MRLKLLLVAGLMLAAAVPVQADPLPVSYWFEPGHIGLWASGMTTNNNPYDLWADRSTGQIVLTWTAPSYSDGQTLVSFKVYRLPDDSTLPLFTDTVSATTHTYTDSAAQFNDLNSYVVTAFFQDANGTITESLPSNLAFSHPVMGSSGDQYPRCTVATVNLGTFPYVFPNPGCVIPPPI